MVENPAGVKVEKGGEVLANLLEAALVDHRPGLHRGHESHDDTVIGKLYKAFLFFTTTTHTERDFETRVCFLLYEKVSSFFEGHTVWQNKYHILTFG